MTSENLEEINKICDQIAELLDGAAPIADPPRLQRVRFLAGLLMGRDPYITTEAGRMQAAADKYFSARKHEKEPGGAEMLMHRMRHSLLNSVRHQAHIIFGPEAPRGARPPEN